MQKAILITFFLIKFYVFTFAQSTILGYVTSEEGKSIAQINVLAYPSSTSKSILAYAISGDNGFYTLKVSHTLDSIYISTKSISYRDTIIAVVNTSQQLDIVLKTEVQRIKEVQVKNWPINSKNDTISYIVSSFSTQSDKAIADVIAKMPGFSIEENGRILYMGSPIEKYYIEGSDLLEGRYPLANNNLPHNAVSSVEVLTNHQPIKMFRGKINTGQTSVNIKLKNNVALTGALYGGIGLPIFLRDINLSPMLFNKNQQIISSFQSNNIGKDLNPQILPLSLSNNMENSGYRNKITTVSIYDTPELTIKKNRFLDNNSNSASYNHLYRLNKTSELKLTSGFLHDIINKTSGID